MRTKIVYLVVVVSLLMLATVVSCGGDTGVNLIFNQGASNCSTVNQSAAVIQCNDSVLTFEGLALTSDPCYYLAAKLDVMDKSNIVIGITVTPVLLGEDVYCVECVGEIAFSGEVSPVGSCSKDVSIIYNGATIAEYEGQ